jgi:hypothetical protein
MTQGAIHNLHFPESIEKVLKVEADAAIELHRIAREEFWRVGSSENGGDLDAAREAANRLRTSREALVKALIRFNDFIRHGTIPEDRSNWNKAGTHNESLIHRSDLSDALRDERLETNSTRSESPAGK